MQDEAGDEVDDEVDEEQAPVGEEQAPVGEEQPPVGGEAKKRFPKIPLYSNKEQDEIIDFMREHLCLYDKRLGSYKEIATKQCLWE